MDLTTDDGIVVPPRPETDLFAGTGTAFSAAKPGDGIALPGGVVAAAGGGDVALKTGRLDVLRGPHDLRPMTCEQGLILRADGSARMCLGDTVVIVGVYGPRALKAGRVEDPDNSTVAVAITGATMSSGTTVEREMEKIVKNVCVDAIVRSAAPRTEVSVIVQIVHDAGSLLACVLNATCLALMDAGIPLRCMFAALTCGFIPGSPGAIMDLNADEEEICTCVATVAYASTVTAPDSDSSAGADVDVGSAPVAVAVAADPEGLLVLHTQGLFESADAPLDEIERTSAAGCSAVLNFFAAHCANLVPLTRPAAATPAKSK